MSKIIVYGCKDITAIYFFIQKESKKWTFINLLEAKTLENITKR